MAKQSDLAERTAHAAKRSVFRDFWIAFLLIFWAIWWGGLSFYALVVVPIGTEWIGSVDQGFITQQVTAWHNRILVLFVVCLGAEAWYQRNWLLSVITAGLLVVSLALFIDHAFLTQQMDFKRVVVPPQFYAQHAVYLWITAAEWGLGLAVPFGLRTLFQSAREVH